MPRSAAASTWVSTAIKGRVDCACGVPFDRLLLTQAFDEPPRLVTADAVITQYGAPSSWCGSRAGAFGRGAPATRPLSYGRPLASASAAMYIDYVYINIPETGMALQIANPVVVAKVERLAKATGLTKTAVVERAIDRLASETQGASDPGQSGARMAALLAQLDRVPERTDAFDPLEWGENGLPK